MGDTSKIEWCDATFNPVRGCTKISPGCKHCYAEQLVITRHKLPVWGPQAPRKVAGESSWKKLGTWNRKAEKAQDMLRVFPSLCDPFEDYCGPNRAEFDAAIDRVFGVIAQTPWIFWMLLTKRPERVLGRVPPAWLSIGWPQNCGVGVSIESQEYIGRLHKLRAVPAPFRFVSYEPALGALDISEAMQGHAPWLDLLIAGGESGKHARPAALSWYRGVKEQCQAFGVSFFLKQVGKVLIAHRDDAPYFGRARSWKATAPGSDMGTLRPKHRKGADLAEWPPDLRVQHFPEITCPAVAY